MDAIESQLAVRNNCEQLQKSIKELYAWEEQIKSADSTAKAQHVDSEGTSLPPVRSDVSAMKVFCEENASAEKQDQADGETLNKARLADAEILKERANKQCKLGNYQAAIDLYTQAIETYPENAIYYSNRALCYMNLEQFDECLRDCRFAIAKDPTYIKAYFRRMQAWERLGENEKAAIECRRIIRLSKDENELNTAKQNLAKLEARIDKRSQLLQKDKRSAAEMNETLALVKQEADKFKDIGNKHLTRKDFQKALQCYTKAIAMFDGDAVYYTNRSLCHWNLKDYEQCLVDCNKAIQLDENYFRPYYRRMQVRELRGAYQGAVEDCKKFLELTTDPKQKATASKDLVRLEKLLKSNEPVKQTFVWSEIKKNAKLTQFIQKPPHMRSKKPLRRVPINDVSLSSIPATKAAGSTRREKIPDSVIDKMFNNHTGERFPAEPEEKTNLEHLFPAHSNKLRNMFSPPTTPNTDQRKEFPQTVATGPEPTPNTDQPKEFPQTTATGPEPVKSGDPLQPHNKTEKDKINLENQDSSEKKQSNLLLSRHVPPLPRSKGEFYATWGGLDEDDRYEYLLMLKRAPLSLPDLFGASLTNDVLSEILYTLKKNFIRQEVDVTYIMEAIAQSESIGILSLMMNNNDRNAIADLLEYMKAQNVKEEVLETIRQKLAP